jgi:hypothetical protein
LLIFVTSCGSNVEIEEDSGANIEVEELQQEVVGDKVDDSLDPGNEEEETDEVLDLYNPGVKELLDKSKAIINYHYLPNSGEEVVIFENKMRIQVIEGGSNSKYPNYVILDTETKEAKGYTCEKKFTNCRDEVDVDYDKYYVKTPLDWLNEQDFTSGVYYPNKQKQVAGVWVANPIEVTEDNVKKTFWFDKNENHLLEIEFYDLDQRKYLPGVLFDTVSLPKNVYAKLVEP